MMDLVTIARGDASRLVEPRRMVVRTADEWRALWAVHAGPDADPPPVDFASRVVAAAFAGERPSSGYSVEIVGTPDSGPGARLAVAERPPSRGTIGAQILTSPFHIVTLPRVAGDVTWTDDGPSSRGGGRSKDSVPDSAAQTTATGLDPRTASVLAYLAGPVSGVLMLIAEGRNEDVRFHAWQSILAIGGLGLLVALGYTLAVASLLVAASAVSFLVRASTAIWLLLIAVWALCLWKAWSTARWKLPLAGDWAERLAARSTPE
jgi:uncharacterized membrane protein